MKQPKFDIFAISHVWNLNTVFDVAIAQVLEHTTITMHCAVIGFTRIMFKKEPEWWVLQISVDRKAKKW